ncbi:FKBP-type peptidyl-prolyl cis-trans isomerase [Synoicihabitans lomoniglobus]|uniref:Peptidyl-prolyl cis-trans isomerase n=1 Tax=Synoicihabitans lomoniglobus TaxID=2909285 RepID=A0AAE9ZSP8_9BACT|nr:FKBP-type peptidyl-prolyl cis-trans isomerase [Opitutaceae bacterium LMO-M01]WED64515.1 FKBP-type peptidyl-prolyl cis-trans isomerase [Opitutaceae bacterium LMO-M01]
MKSIIATIVIIAAVVGGLWWFTDQQNQRAQAEAEVARLAAIENTRAERLALFGEAALAEGIEWSDTGMGMLRIEEGTGSRPYPGAYVKFNYVVRLKDGVEVQRTEKPTEARIGQMVPGMSSGLQQMKTGGRAVLFIPPKLGYGGSAYGPIPANAGLIFEVELLPN